MQESELRRLRAELLKRYLTGEIDKVTYDQMAAELKWLDAPERLVSVDGAPSVELQETSHDAAAETPCPDDPPQPSPRPKPRRTAKLRPGAMVGAVRLGEMIGQSSTAEVWKAHDPEQDRFVALKLLSREAPSSAAEIVRLDALVEQLRLVEHEHICPIHAWDHDEHLGHYMATDYVDSGTLRDRLASSGQKGGVLAREQVVQVLEPVAGALDFAHRHKVYHRGLKPQNILFDRGRKRVFVADFAFPAELREMWQAAGEMAMCEESAPYLAPEQWRGEPVDGRTDQYALGVVAYEMLSGCPPFAAPDVEVLRQCVVSDTVRPLENQADYINKALARALSKRREERFDSCTNFLLALKQVPAKVLAAEIEGDVAFALDVFRRVGTTQQYVNEASMNRLPAWREAAEAEIPGGQWLIGELMMAWNDHQEAIKWFQRATKLAFAAAFTGLGYCYDHGLGVDMDHEKALECFHEAAELGDVCANYFIGSCHEYGRGVRVSHREALRWYAKAAERGHRKAQAKLRGEG